MAESILRVKQVAEKIGVSVATVWNKTNSKHRLYDATFPRPFKISANATGWLASEIDDYIGKLAAKREEQAN